MNGPSVTVVPRMVFASDTPWSWCPPSSRPVAPHFSYQALTSAYQAPYSGVSDFGSSGVSRISSTYFTRVSFSSWVLLFVGAPLRTPSVSPTNAAVPDPTPCENCRQDFRAARSTGRGVIHSRVLRQRHAERLGRAAGEHQVQVTAVLLRDLVDVRRVGHGGDEELRVAALGAVGLLPEATDRQEATVWPDLAGDGYLGAGQLPGYQGG